MSSFRWGLLVVLNGYDLLHDFVMLCNCCA